MGSHLKVLLSMEDDTSCLDLAVLNVDLVSSQDNRDVFTDTDKIPMPVGYVLVGNS